MFAIRIWKKLSWGRKKKKNFRPRLGYSNPPGPPPTVKVTEDGILISPVPRTCAPFMTKRGEVPVRNQLLGISI